MKDDETKIINTDEINEHLSDTLNLEQLSLDGYSDLEDNDEPQPQYDFIQYDDNDDEFKELLYTNNLLDRNKDLTFVDFEEIDNQNNLSGLKKEPIADNRTHLEQKGYVRKVNMPEKPKTVKRKSTKNIKNDNAPTSNIYIITLIIAIVACIIVFAVVFIFAFNSNSSGNNKPVVATPTPEVKNTTDIKDISTVNDYAISTGVIENIAKSGSIQLYDLITNETVNFKYVSTTKLVDQYGKPMVIEEFKNGYVVDYKHKQDETNLAELSISKDQFKETKITNAKNDTLEKTILAKDKLYKYDENTIVNFDRGTYTPEEICEYDVFDISGYKDSIYIIDVIKGHGTVKFIQDPSIINGIVEIDTTETYKLEELNTITLSEGAHRVVIKGDNIDPYISDILVEPNKVTEIALDFVQEKQGLFVLNISPEGTTVTIDGDIIDTTKNILLDYGPHTILVSKTGYNSYQNTITINAPETRMSIALEPKVMQGKLSIDTDPVGAQIYVDNVNVGISPITTPIEYGTHNIQIKMDGYIDITYSVDITDSKTKALAFNLQKKDPIIQ